MGVIPHASVEAFFHEVITDALSSQDVEATEHTEFYLVGLLGEFARARIPDEPLSLTLAQSRGGGPQERIRALKQVGDISLYVTGFFSESFERKLVDPDYYIGLGEAAYGELASRLGSAGTIQGVYEELAAKFPRFVDVLHEVRSKVSFAGTDVVKLYQEWLRTRSDWVEQRMRGLGLVVPGDDSVH
jgi:hypothetical protein